MPNIRILIHDLTNSEEAWYEFESNDIEGEEYYWTEGNNSCDCNRRLHLNSLLNTHEQKGVYCSNNRIILKEVQIDGVNFNWERI